MNVWEEICVHASKYKKIAFAGVMLALTEVGIALGSVIETNTLFTGGGVLLCRDCDSGIWIEKRGRLFTGWNFAGNPSVSE